MVNPTADVVIIGAGIQGLSAAYHITALGISKVIVVEKELTSDQGSSGRSASLLMLQREKEEKIRFSQYSFERYMNFEDEFGVDTEYKKVGFLSLATEAVEETVIKEAKLKQELGVTTEILTPEVIKSFLPWVNVEDIAVGVLGPDDGIVNPHAIIEGFKKKAKENGARIEYSVRATGITVMAGKVAGVQTTNGFISTPIVVNAAGAGAIEVGEWVGLNLPIDNAVRSIFHTAPVPEIPDITPIVEDDEAEWYYRKELSSVLMGMGKEKDTKVGWEINHKLLPEVRKFAHHRVPILADVRVESGWSGVRPLTPDGLPIIGPVPEIEGFVNDCGWGGEGIQHAPAGGITVAQHVVGEEKFTLDHKSFLLSRF